MTTQRIVRKNLAGEEDLLLGEGTVVQTRNNADYTITKNRMIRPVNSITELNALDPDKFKKAALYEDSTVTFYAYNAGSGLWEAQLPQSKVAGAIGDGVANDYPAIHAAWLAMLASGSKILDLSGGLTYRFGSVALEVTKLGTKCYLTTDGIDNVELIMGASTIFVDPPTGQGATVLFESRGTDGFTFDYIRLEVDSTRAAAGDTTEALNVTYDTKASSNTHGKAVITKNAGGVALRTDNTDYATNGFDSVFRPFNTFIDTISIDNTAMPFTFANEYTGYGLVCALCGDNTEVKTVIADNIHRGVFVYGAKGVRVNGGKITESNAATVNVGSLASVIDIEISMSVVQNTNLSTSLTQLLVHEVGTAEGGSVDLENARAHTMSGIDINLAISGAATTNDSGFDMNKTTGDNLDSSIVWRDINVSIRNLLVVSRSFTIFTAATTQKYQNTIASGIRVNNCVVASHAGVNLIPGLIDNIKVDNFTGNNLYCGYGDTVSTTPPTDNEIVLDNSICQGTISNAGLYDCPVTVMNSRVAEVVHINNTIPAYNKVFINSYIGGKYIGHKGKFDIYTNSVDSSAMYEPDSPVNNLAIGGNIATTNSTPLNLDLTAPVNKKTTIAANLYHDLFTGNSVFTASTPMPITILAARSGSSGFGIATGMLVAYGAGIVDFTTGTYELEITSVINTGAQAFIASDFSISALDADTLRISCSREAADMYVAVQHIGL